MAKKDGIAIKIGGVVDKTWQSSLNVVGTSLAKLGKHVSKNMRDYTNGSKAVQTYKQNIAHLESVIRNGNSTTRGYNETIRNTTVQNQQLKKSTNDAKIKLYELQKQLNALNSLSKNNSWGSLLTEKQKDKIIPELSNKDFKNSQDIEPTRGNIAQAKVNQSTEFANYKKLQAELDKYTKKLEGLKEGQRGWVTASKNVDTYTKRVAKSKAKLDEFTQQIKDLENKLAQLTSIENLSEKSEFYPKVKQMGMENYDKQVKSITASMEKLNATIESNNRAQQHNQAVIATTRAKSSEYYTKLAEDLGRYTSLLDQAQEKAKTAAQNIKQTISTYIVQSISSGFSKASTSVKNFAKQVVKWLGKCAGVIAQTATNAKTMQKMFSKVIQYGFGFRSLYYLLNNVKSALADGLEYISQATSSGSAGVSEVAQEMAESLKTIKELVYFLKSAGATMIQPFVQLLPYVQKLVDWFSKLSASVATFVAQLTGQAYILKASTNLEDYSNALDETASSAKDATKALGAYDKLNVISQDKGSSSSSSAIDTGSWFTKENIDTSPFIDKVKDAMSELLSLTDKIGDELIAKFESIGADIGAWISNKLASINWEDILTKAFNFSTALASVINGILSDPNLGTEIGNGVAQLLNTIVVFTSTFFDTVDFTQLGTQMAKAINKALTTFDFKQLGEGIHDIANGILIALATLLSDPNFGTNVGKAIGDLLAGLDLGDIASKLGNVMSQIASAISDALESWAETDPDSFGLAKALLVAWGLAKLSSTLVGPLSTILGSVVQKSVENMVVEPIAEKLSGKLTTAMSTKMSDTGGFAGAKFLAGFGLALGGGTTAISMFVSQWQTGVDTIKMIIMSIGAVVAGIGVALLAGASVVLGGVIGLVVAVVAGIVLVVREHWDEIKEWASEAWSNIKEWFGNLGQGIADWWSDTKQKWSDNWDAIKKKWEDFKDNLAQSWSTAWGNLKTKVTDIWDGIKDKWSNMWSNIKDKWTTFKTDFGNMWTKFWDSISTKWSNFWNGLKSTAKSIVNGIIGIVNGLLSAIQSGLNWVINKLNKISLTLPSFLGGGRIGFNLSEISLKQIPYLAQGAVIPPNKEFMAVLGDQKQGTNIEAPLETIKQALAETLSAYAGTTNNQPIVLQLDGKTVAKVVWDENKKRYKQTGKAYSY